MKCCYRPLAKAMYQGKRVHVCTDCGKVFQLGDDGRMRERLRFRYVGQRRKIA